MTSERWIDSRGAGWFFKNLKGIVFVVLIASAFIASYFTAWQVAVAVTLLAIGIYIWWRSSRPRKAG